MLGVPHPLLVSSGQHRSLVHGTDPHLSPQCCPAWPPWRFSHFGGTPEAFPTAFTPLGCARAGAAGEARGSFWDRKSASSACSSPCLGGAVIFSRSPHLTSLARLLISFFFFFSLPSINLLCAIFRLGQPEPGIFAADRSPLLTLYPEGFGWVFPLFNPSWGLPPDIPMG